jgi:hypothetical protein
MPHSPHFPLFYVALLRIAQLENTENLRARPNTMELTPLCTEELSWLCRSGFAGSFRVSTAPGVCSDDTT